MHKRIVRFALIMTLGLVWTACSSSIQTDLNNLLAEKWTAYGSGKPNFGGGLAMYIISPQRNYYASTNMPNGTEDTHFRGASTTKTFTAAAIMLLHQQGKLSIYDLITANIPGTSDPYIPDTADYNIPNKDRITIQMLLNHRAGVFDVANEAIPDDKPVDYHGQNYIQYVLSSDPTHTFTFDELVGVVATNDLSYFAPDTGYHYSDTGYSMLSKIIERISGQRYDQFLHDNFIPPTGNAYADHLLLSQTSHTLPTHP